MKLRVLLVFLVHCVFGQEPEASPPLPSADPLVVDRFRLALEAVFGVGIRLQAFLQDDQNENFLVSPISAAVIIGQLILGAEGRFRTELVELLALPNRQMYENEELSHYNNAGNVTYHLPYTTLHLQLSLLLQALESGDGKHFVLTEKSAVFFDQRIGLNDTFRKNMKMLYQARMRPLDFVKDPTGTQRTINAWASHNTNGLIKSILAAPPSPTTSSIFANAIYFKAQWAMPFSDMLNRKGPFNVSSVKQVPVTYMINFCEQIFYSESADYRMIALPYIDEELGMYLMLPRDNSPFKFNIKGFVENMKSLEVLETISRGKRRDVVIKIPKMTLKYSFSILDQLKKYRAFKKQPIKLNSTNVVDKLDDKVDAFNNFTTEDEKDIFLTKAAVGENLRVDDIVQQVVISINEKGTEAAAVSASTIDYMGGSKNFLIERPFVFFIRHEATSATLFWGTVSNPAA